MKKKTPGHGCCLCGGEFAKQDGYLIFWTGNDGRHYCTPQHAIDGGGDPEKGEPSTNHMPRGGSRR